METLVKLGVAGATPFVLQFLLELLPADQQAQLSKGLKMGLSIFVGAVLSVIIAWYKNEFPDTHDLRLVSLLVLDGGIQGAMATGAVSLFQQVARKAGSATVVNTTDSEVQVVTSENATPNG